MKSLFLCLFKSKNPILGDKNVFSIIMHSQFNYHTQLVTPFKLGLFLLIISKSNQIIHQNNIFQILNFIFQFSFYSNQTSCRDDLRLQQWVGVSSPRHVLVFSPDFSDMKLLYPSLFCLCQQFHSNQFLCQIIYIFLSSNSKTES